MGVARGVHRLGEAGRVGVGRDDHGSRLGEAEQGGAARGPAGPRHRHYRPVELPVSVTGAVHLCSLLWASAHAATRAAVSRSAAFPAVMPLVEAITPLSFLARAS